MQQTDTARWHCSRSCYSCLEPHLDYRYRLALRVTRDNTIFGVTVFGSCLNPLFGAPATDLHRLVEESSGPVGSEGQRSGCRSRLLVKAVEDCFIGRHFVFGIKISGPHPYRREAGQFIASQISLPMASVPGCSVVSYYRTLLQQAALCADWTTDPRPASKSLLQQASVCRTDPRPAPQPSADTSTAPLLLHPSPLHSFDSTLPSCGRSMSLHCTLTLTPTPTNIHKAPWQQSPGVITSSAEQEEDMGGGEDKGLSHGEGGHSRNSSQREGGHSRNSSQGEGGHSRNSSQGEGGHSRNSSQGEGGHSRNSSQGEGGHSRNSSQGEGGHSRNSSQGEGGHSRNSSQGEGGHSRNSSQGEGGHSSQGEGGHSRNSSQGEGGHSRNSSQGEGGHSRNSYWDVLSSFCEGSDSLVHPPASLTWTAPTQCGYIRTVPSSLRKRSVSDMEEEYRSVCEQTCRSDFVAWEDLPFSECLGEFICDPADTQTPTDHHAQTSPVGKNVSTTLTDTESSPTSHRSLLDITNVGQHGGLSPRLPGHTADLGEYNCSADHRHTHTPHRHTADLGEYNCSADLFHCSQTSTDSHTPRTDTHTPGPDTHTPRTDTHTPRTDTHTPRTDSHTPRTDTHTPCTDTHTPRTDTHTPTMDTPSECCDCVPLSQSTPIIRKTAPPHTLQVKARRHTPKGLTHTKRPRDNILALQCQRFTRRVLKRTPGGRRPGSMRLCDDDMVISPTQRPWCSRRTDKQQAGGERENRGRTTGGERENRGRTTGGERENRRSTHIHQTLREGQTEGLANQQLEDSRSVSPSLHEENEACDWSRDLFTDSF
ncbi:uncharacterized protein ddias isoform X2 [Oncorhynchus kisutch]|nr:DNA damage-induced apoptosis suppressor protein isoform X2 [Oncorhynchus kisutch]